jgi:cystathionine beta-lyase
MGGPGVNPFDAVAPGALRLRRSAKWAAHGADVLPMWVAEMDVALAEPVREALADAVGRSDTGYAHPGRLGEAFAAFAADRWDWSDVEPGRTMLVPDVMRGIAEALRVLTPDGAAVVLDTPAYPPFFHWITDIGRRYVPVPDFDLGRLERAFADGAAAYLLCNPHNPTGTVRTRAELEAIAELADRYDVQVVVDEIHAPLVYDGAVHVPFASLDAPAARRAVVLVSASKAWNLAGLKAALLVAGPGSWPVVSAIPDEVRYGSGLLGVIATEAAWLAGTPWLDEVLTVLDGRRRLLADLLAEQAPAVGYAVPAATYLAWLDFRGTGLGDDPAVELLRRGGVALSSGPTFGTVGRGYARLNFGTSEAVLRDGVARIASALRA